MDCGASSGTGGADGGDGFPLWNGEGGRKCEGDVHPVAVSYTHLRQICSGSDGKSYQDKRI